jgi:hypothetical protein
MLLTEVVELSRARARALLQTGADPKGAYNPDFFIKYVLINLKSSLISSFCPKFLLFSPSFVFILDPPLPADYGSVLKDTGGF